MILSTWTSAFLATAVISTIPNLLLVFLPEKIFLQDDQGARKNDGKKKTKLNIGKMLVMFSVAGLLGDVFLHALPHILNDHAHHHEVDEHPKLTKIRVLEQLQSETQIVRPCDAAAGLLHDCSSSTDEMSSRRIDRQLSAVDDVITIDHDHHDAHRSIDAEHQPRQAHSHDHHHAKNVPHKSHGHDHHDHDHHDHDHHDHDHHGHSQSPEKATPHESHDHDRDHHDHDHHGHTQSPERATSQESHDHHDHDHTDSHSHPSEADHHVEVVDDHHEHEHEHGHHDEQKQQDHDHDHDRNHHARILSDPRHHSHSSDRDHKGHDHSHDHSHDQHDHSHDDGHGHSHGLTSKGVWVPLLVLLGFLVFYLTDKSAQMWLDSDDDHAEKEHGHDHSHSHGHHHMKASGWLNLVADTMHNFTDGITIGVAFTTGSGLAIATFVSVLIHELPHELSDFTVLLRSGVSKWNAIRLQFVTAIGAMLGTAVGLYLAEDNKFVQDVVGSLTAGGFVYIAAVSLTPEILRDSRHEPFLQVLGEALCFAAGVALMVLVGFMEAH